MNALKPASRKPQTDFVANAIAGWGSPLPDWIAVLAEQANRTSGGHVASVVGYSPAVITTVINNTYRGALKTVEARVRGALLSEEVECPIVGAIRRDRCIDEQNKNFRGTSAQRTRLYNACRSGCPHSRLKGGGDV